MQANVELFSPGISMSSSPSSFSEWQSESPMAEISRLKAMKVSSNRQALGDPGITSSALTNGVRFGPRSPLPPYIS